LCRSASHTSGRETKHSINSSRLFYAWYAACGLCGGLIAMAGPSIPIVLITAALDPAVRAAELKLTHWVSKPFDMSVLEALFKQAA